MRLPRHAQVWLSGYLKDRLRAVSRPQAKRVWLMFADHFEPLWNRVDEQTAAARVARWTRRWPHIASIFRDAGGRAPRYTFFYPEEEYRPRLLAALEPLVEDGVADVEIHLHHDGEGEQDFVDRMSSFISVLRNKHNFLRTDGGKPIFGFIHGMWALDNSRPDGRFCGLNNEITLLRKLGCYGDFTMPSGGAPTQARMVNTIYWANDDPGKPKSYDTGVPVRPGDSSSGDLLMIPGPFGIRWKERFLPRIEAGELASYDPPTLRRVQGWLGLAPRIGQDIFVKLHTHGAQEQQSAFLLGKGLEQTIRLMSNECASEGYELWFASAWEMRQALEAARRNLDFLELVGANKNASRTKAATGGH